jgi:hypothetical protein
VVDAFDEVAADRGDGGRPDRDGAEQAALALPDRDPVEVEVEVGAFEGGDFAGTDAGLGHQPDEGLVAAVVQPLSGAVEWARAGRDEGAELVVGQRQHDRAALGGALDAPRRGGRGSGPWRAASHRGA